MLPFSVEATGFAKGVDCSPQQCRTAMSSLTRQAKPAILSSLCPSSSPEAVQPSILAFGRLKRRFSDCSHSLSIRPQAHCDGSRLLTALQISPKRMAAAKSMFGTRLRNARYHQRWPNTGYCQWSLLLAIKYYLPVGALFTVRAACYWWRLRSSQGATLAMCGHCPANRVMMLHINKQLAARSHIVVTFLRFHILLAATSTQYKHTPSQRAVAKHVET